MSFYPELTDLTLDQLIERFHGLPLEGQETATVYYDEVAVLIRQHGDAGVAFLLSEREYADEDRLRGILLGLTYPRSDDPALPEMLLSYLQDERPLIVADAIDGLRRQGTADAHDRVITLRDHSSPYGRARVLDYLSALYPGEALPMLLAALHDSDYIVRESAVDDVDDMGAVEALEAIRPLLSDAHPDVRQAVETAIQHLEELKADQAVLRSDN